MMHKKGFSLAELIIAMAIIGFVVGAAMVTFKSFDKGVKYVYSNTYYVLDRALYNTVSYWIPSEPVVREPFKTSVINPENNQSVTISDTDAASRMCRALIEYINPVNNVDRDAMCNNITPVSDIGPFAANGTDLATPHFTATNGVRFWISRRYPDSTDASNDGKMKFFIIYADMNGVRLPNSMDYEEGNANNHYKTKDPDIFAFAALEDGRICPIGIPEVEPRYMTTRIVYQDVHTQIIEGNEVDDVVLRYSSPSKPYVISKAEAWGYYLPESKVPDEVKGQQEADNKPAGDGEPDVAVEPVPAKSHTVADTEIINDEPLTYNGYLLNEISVNSKIYAFLKKSDGKRMTMSEYVQANSKDFSPEFNSVYTDEEGNKTSGYGCRWMSDEECTVSVDKYVY